jgi:hypothetical protein
MGEMRNAYKILIEKSEGKRSLGQPRHKRERNRLLKWILKKPGGAGVSWIHLAQDRH